MGMLDMIKGRCASCLGMELSTHAAKVVLLQRKGRRFMLQKGVVAPLPRIFLNMSNEKKAELGRQLTSICRTAEIREKKVSLSIPGSLSLTGRMRLPASAENRIEREVFLKIREYMPGATLDEFILDHFVYASTREMLDILYVMVKREVVEFYHEVFTSSELDLQVIYPTPFALANVTNVNYPDELVDLPFLVIDIGADESDLILLKENRVVASINLEVGGSLVTRDLAGKKGLSFKEAEKIKLMGRGDERILRESSNKMALMLKEGFDHCLKTATEFLEDSLPIETIYLTGGGSLSPFLVAELADLLSIQVEHLLPIRKIDLHPDLNSQHTYEISCQLSGAIGTALVGAGLSGI